MRNKQYALLGAPKYNKAYEKSYAEVLELCRLQRGEQIAAKANVRRLQHNVVNSYRLTIEDLEILLQTLDSNS